MCFEEINSRPLVPNHFWKKNPKIRVQKFGGTYLSGYRLKIAPKLGPMEQ